MKIARLFSTFAAAAVLLVCSAPVFAGSTRANVPFAFEVAGKVMPAGEYRFVCPTGSQVMQVIGQDGNTAFAFVREAGQNLQDAQVRFDKAGSAAKLSSVVIHGKTGFRTVAVR